MFGFIFRTSLAERGLKFSPQNKALWFLNFEFKGGYIARSKYLKIHFIFLSDRVNLDKSIGTGLTVKFGLVCLPDTK